MRMRNFAIWSVLYYLRFWARLALALHRPYVIGIAGSVGKSSTRNALFAVLKDYFSAKVVSGNSETGIPLGILGIEIDGFNKKNWLKTLCKAPLRIFNLRGVQYLVVEMGIDDPYPPKNMSYLLTIVKPDMSIDLNATATHTQQFEKLLRKHTKDSMEYLLRKIAEEDSKIITNGYTKVGIYNADDVYIANAVAKNAKKENVTLLTFGKEKTNDISFQDYILTTKKTKFSYNIKALRSNISIEFALPGMLLPPASKESFAAVTLAARALGLKNYQIKESLEKNFSIPRGRSSLFEGIKGSIIIDSSYNSSKSTVLSFLEMLKILKERTQKPVFFLMGDMRELGGKAQAEHEEVARKLVKIVDFLYCVGPLTQEFVMPTVKEFEGKKGLLKSAEWYKNAIQAGLHLKEELLKDSIVLVKGSQNTIFLEEAVKFILQNQSDVKNLARQEDYWMKYKQEFFSV